MFKASQLNSNRVTLEQGLLIPVFLFLITLPFSGYGSHRRVPGLSNPGTLPSRTSPVGQAVLGFSGSDGWPFLPSSAKCLPAPIDPLPVKDHLGLQWPRGASWPWVGSRWAAWGWGQDQTSHGQWARALASGHADLFLQRGQCGGRRGWNPETSLHKNSCSPPQSDPCFACLGHGSAHGQSNGKRRRGFAQLAGLWQCEPCQPLLRGLSLLAPLLLLPACPSGLLGRHHYCPHPAPPAGPKGDLTHGAATSPRLAGGV